MAILILKCNSIVKDLKRIKRDLFLIKNLKHDISDMSMH